MTKITPSDLLNPTEKTIKNWNCSFIAVEGPNIIDKLSLEDLAIPYESQYRSRVILKSGEVNVPLLYSFIGKAVTFLMIKVTYDSENDPYYRYEQENYNIEYYFENDRVLKPLNRLMILTGSGEDKIPQIYLNNPLDYDVTLDVLHATVDTDYDDDNFSAAENIILNSNISSIELNEIKYSGIITTSKYGEDINAGDILYIGDDEMCYRASAYYSYISPSIYLALESGASGDTRNVLVNGFVDFYNWDYQPGKRLYCSGVSGLMTQDLDDIYIGDSIQLLGVATKNKTIYFNPSLDVFQKH